MLKKNLIVLDVIIIFLTQIFFCISLAFYAGDIYGLSYNYDSVLLPSSLVCPPINMFYAGIFIATILIVVHAIICFIIRYLEKHSVT